AMRHPSRGWTPAIETLAARRHRVADIDAARRVVLDPNLAQVVGLLIVDGILIAGGAGRPQRDDAIVERILDIPRDRTGDVGADLIQLPGDDGVDGGVVADPSR